MNHTLSRTLHASTKGPAGIVLCLLALLNGCVTPVVLQTHEPNFSTEETVVASKPNTGANPDWIRPGESIGETGVETAGSEAPQVPAEDPPYAEPWLSPQAQKYAALCLLAGPLCAGVLLYVGGYVASMAAVCTPVAAITTPMSSNGFKEEFRQCMRVR